VAIGTNSRCKRCIGKRGGKHPYPNPNHDAGLAGEGAGIVLVLWGGSSSCACCGVLRALRTSSLSDWLVPSTLLLFRGFR
jgi:hypothetical protein